MAPRKSSSKRRAPRDAESKSENSGWRTALKISLISIPVRVVSATKRSDVSFRQLHRKCKTPIQMKKWCPHCEEEVTADDLVKGHETSKGRFVVAEKEEIDALRPKSSRTIDIGRMMTTAAIDPVYIERTYYLVPGNEEAGSPFAVVREGLADRAAIGRMSMFGREYLVAVVAADDVMRLHTLRTEGEVRGVASVGGGVKFARARTSPAEVKLARQVLGSLPAEDDLSAFTDHYQKALRQLLADKEASDEVAETDEAPRKGRDNVVPLMEALRRSLESTKSQRKPAARKKAKVVRHPASRRTRRAS